MYMDRGGSREGKKSLRKNKITINAINKGKPELKDVDATPTPCPLAPPIPRSGHAEAVIDVGVHLSNRQFDANQTKMLQRARDSGVEAIVTLCTDIEKQKPTLQAAVLSEHPLITCAVGIHPNMVSSHRISDKQVTTWVNETAVLAKNPLVVAIDCGLDFSREYGTWHMQEKAFSMQIDLATALQLPVIMHDIKATERMCEIIAAKRLEGHLQYGYCIFDFAGAPETLQTYLDLDAHIMLAGHLCDPGPLGEPGRALCAMIPENRLMIGSNAPFTTPQNIEDYYVRDARNEPSNIVRAIMSMSCACSHDAMPPTPDPALRHQGCRSGSQSARCARRPRRRRPCDDQGLLPPALCR
eukprot:m.25179 g.25179  ORF g.25179 m.25179 type:complete len:355 (+) comp4125_c0_seq1:62-1126(+)